MSRKVLFLLVGTSILLGMFSLSPKSEALSGSEFQAGRIIDDGVFFNGNSMNPSQIQAFLNAKLAGGACDTNGTQPYGGTTRAAYGTSRGYPPPYTCLKDYVQSTPTRTAEAGLCDTYTGGTKSSAQIIYDVGIACGVNQKILLILLEKEQSLLTDNWPWSIQYRSATGYGCPDTAPCDSEYYGFFNQVYMAARQYKKYARDESTYRYRTARDNYIQYNPNAGCGGTNVHIQNQATAGLYNYTPYQPNGPALTNLYGTGDGCSAYGNRNFWRMYNDWFGSTFGGDPVSANVRLVSAPVYSPANPVANQAFTVSFTVKNFGSSTETHQNRALQCRVNVYTGCDPEWQGSTSIASGAEETITYSFPSGLNAGNYRFTPFFYSGGLWSRYGSGAIGSNSFISTIPDVRIVGAIKLNPSDPQPGENVNVSYIIKNFGVQTVPIDTSVFQCRVNISTNCDSNYGGSTSLAPGAQLPVHYSFTAPAEGEYNLVPYFKAWGRWYTYKQFSSIPTTMQLSIRDLRLITPITSSPVSPIPGQTPTISYTIQNFGTLPAVYQSSVLQCRLNTNTVCDPAAAGATTINPGEQRTFNHTLGAVSAGTYKLTPFYKQNNTWYKYNGAGVGGDSLSLVVPKYVADMRLVSPISASPTNPVPGQSVTVSYTVQNFGSQTAFYQNSITQCRLNNSTNCDSAQGGATTINAGAQRTFTHTVTAIAGTYKFTPYFMQNNTWYKYNGAGAGRDSLSLVVPKYVADMRLITPITSSPVSPIPGQTPTISYTIQNFGTLPAVYQSSVLQCRLNTNTVCDPAAAGATTINPGEQRTFNHTLGAVSAGTYKLTPFYKQNNTWYKYNGAGVGGDSLSLVVN